MKFDPQKHHRRSIRLRGYDYSQAGAYFVTVVAYQRECLFGAIRKETMILNRRGEIIQKWWGEISNHFPNVETGAFIVMPNHVHGIIIIRDNRRGTDTVPHDGLNLNNNSSSQHYIEIIMKQGRETPPLRSPTLGQIVAYFKYQSTKEMNALDGTDTITKFWQRNYYEHIIHDDREMDNIWRYSESNPSAWAEDEENPSSDR